MIPRRLVLIVGLACWIPTFAQQIVANSDKAHKTKELTKAMQSAQMLLSELSDAFSCNYASYEVKPTAMVDSTTFLVVIEVEDDTCDDMVKALNYEGAKLNLAFVSEKEMPEMTPLPEPAPDLPENLRTPPSDYTLIHEVDPPIDQ